MSVRQRRPPRSSRRLHHSQAANHRSGDARNVPRTRSAHSPRRQIRYQARVRLLNRSDRRQRNRILGRDEQGGFMKMLSDRPSIEGVGCLRIQSKCCDSPAGFVVAMCSSRWRHPSRDRPRSRRRQRRPLADASSRSFEHEDRRRSETVLDSPLLPSQRTARTVAQAGGAPSRRRRHRD